MDVLVQSAGILVYRRTKGFIEVLLCKSGGPYYINKERCWGIPKGLVEPGEDVLKAAKREFKEETNFEIHNDLEFLNKYRVTKVKEVTIFCIEEDVDISDFKSNTFELEYPKKSGNIQTFFENEKADWVNIEEAKDIIFVGQIQILEELEEKLEGK